MSVSPDVVIMTKTEFEKAKDDAFQKGVRRGEFSAGSKHCHGGRDGDCFWWLCPQTQAGEPARSGRHCPLDKMVDE